MRDRSKLLSCKVRVGQLLPQQYRQIWAGPHTVLRVSLDGHPRDPGSSPGRGTSLFFGFD